MSLEVAIQENTAAIRELLAVIARGVPTGVAAVASQATVDTNGASSTQGLRSPPPAEAAAPAAAKPTAAESATYDDVKKAILKLSSAKGRDQVVSVLGQFGAAKGPDLKPEQYAAFVAKVNDALRG